MSHFVVLVVGPNVEKQLAPYEENLQIKCEPKEVSSENIDDVINQLKEKNILEPSVDQVINQLKEYYGCEYYLSDIGKILQTTIHNPEGFWDWYQIGGRWAGFFPLKPTGRGKVCVHSRFAPEGRWVPASLREVSGTDTLIDPGTDFYSEVPAAHADQCYLKHVWFEKEILRMREEAIKTFKEWKKCFEIEKSPPLPWSFFISEVDKNILFLDQARNIYNNQIAIKMWRNTEEGRWSLTCPVDNIGFDEITYTNKTENSSLIPYAYVLEGKWHAKGEMGWFGMSNDVVTQENWNKEVQNLYKTLPGETLLTIVDCHI